MRYKAIDAFRQETAKTGRDVHDEPAAERLPEGELTTVKGRMRLGLAKLRLLLGEPTGAAS